MERMAKSVLKTLTDYFNVDEGKRSMKEWADELRAFTPEEKRALAEAVSRVTGEPLTST